jgi:hypothetical protein
VIGHENIILNSGTEWGGFYGLFGSPRSCSGSMEMSRIHWPAMLSRCIYSLLEHHE